MSGSANKNKKSNNDKIKDKIEKNTAEDNPETETANNGEKSEVEGKQEELKTSVEPGKARLEQLEKDCTDLKDQLLRQMAEFENFRKRTTKEKTEAYSISTVNCVKEFLTVLDNFERAMSSPSTDEAFKNGVGMILKQFTDVLLKLGVEEIEALNKPFNPELHEAVNQIEDENFPENTVCNVFQKGYILGEKVIRHAMVIVANP